jgi:vacuolar protein sorting-associated protein 13A/C
MKAHRALVRLYRQAWLVKLTEKKPSPAVLKQIEDIESQLDVFNLNVARQQADMDVERLGLLRAEDIKDDGWLAWMGWGSSNNSSAPSTAKVSSVGALFFPHALVRRRMAPA